MKLIKQLLLSCLVSICMIQQGVAEVDRQFYETVVPLADETEASQQQAIQAAFKQVVTMVTGSEEVLSHPEIQAASAEASRYVVKYGEQRQASDGEQASLKQLAVSFDPTAVRLLLKKNGFNAWDQQREETLVWLIEEKPGGKRQIFSSEDEEETTIDALKAQAKQHHIPLILPIMDFEDSSSLSEVDAWGLFSDAINKASTRYQAKSVLAGRIYAISANQYSGRWVLLLQGNQYVEDLSKVSMQDFMQAGIKLVASKLSGAYTKQQVNQADPATTTGGLQLTVQGVQGLTAYASVSKFLEKLAVVEEVSLLEVTDSQASFELVLKGDVNALQDELETSGYMQLIDAPQSTEGASRQLVYQWVKE
ncbi:DUF2066 domain-containing protein [Endozoicomonas sp. SM1973]|uniref:DUF2066 domain-containing protein n=1 Tax=Spartinivicinus marinus TaxID=2994442 RepID=A0A853I5P5_9GAMM|nr:DUF2066 domain-containing protein [Spartinivicinus marinus]MCX4028699.1 DUF2066 domain-containing protein [Spartinivicinus marinus]NYZ68039.1 DUF2066 domain-containing protein [Spartinivicinus marinus]